MYFIVIKTVHTLHKSNGSVFLSFIDGLTFYQLLLWLTEKEGVKELWFALFPTFLLCHRF